jgi:hypothetical protein
MYSKALKFNQYLGSAMLNEPTGVLERDQGIMNFRGLHDSG